MGKIFVSHAVADRDLVDAFVDFLQTGCGVVLDDIFCSSLEGMTIPEGSTFVTFMEETLRDAEFVIMIISPSYYESIFCLCELGATWILQHNNFPILVPPLDWSDLSTAMDTNSSNLTRKAVRNDQGQQQSPIELCYLHPQVHRRGARQGVQFA